MPEGFPRYDLLAKPLRRALLAHVDTNKRAQPATYADYLLQVTV